MAEIVIQFPDSGPEVRLLFDGTGQPRAKDLLYAGLKAKGRIFERTLAGRDFEDRPFAPYSKRGPVYWYPKQGAPNAARRASVNRYARIMGGRVTSSGLGLKFANYAALKAALGRSGGVVDLYGPGPGPHMLNALDVRISGNVIRVGIYTDREAQRADAHNEGLGHMPERRFLDVSEREAELIALDIVESMQKD